MDKTPSVMPQSTDLRNEAIADALNATLTAIFPMQTSARRCTVKSLDIFSVHEFPVGLIQCESNLLEIMKPGHTMRVGSCGWANIIEKFKKTKSGSDTA